MADKCHLPTFQVAFLQIQYSDALAALVFWINGEFAEVLVHNSPNVPMSHSISFVVSRHSSGIFPQVVANKRSSGWAVKQRQPGRRIDVE